MSDQGPTDPKEPQAFEPEEWPSAGVGSRVTRKARPEPAPRRVLGSLGFSLDVIRRRRSARIVLWTLVVAMGLGGVGLLAYPFATDVWADRIQGGLQQELQAVDVSQGRTSFTVKQRKEGSALTRMIIPKLKVNRIVVEGITGNALRAGLGHYPHTALPGEATGNVGIAGHRTGFGQPFRHLDKLREGDRITLVTPFGRYIYEVIGPFDGHRNPWITHAKDWSVVSPTPVPALTLTTCDPPGTSKNRLIVRAHLIRSVNRT